MKIKRKTVFGICLFVLCTLLMVFLAPQREKISKGALKGLWVATVHNIDFPSAPNLSEAALKSELFEIVQSAKNGGYNAIFFQVRPACDALYESKIFPYSSYLGTQFDALKYLCELGKKYEIEIHAWINPYRVTASEGQEPFIKENTVLCGGKYYLDPGEPSNISLVCEGVSEILENYGVAGIHFDDYFYPSSDFDDAASYEKYGGGMDIEDWRRQNTYALIEAVSKTVKEKSDTAVFGVSPVGIWRNAANDARGSQTSGYSGYDDIYADALSWAENSLVDYLAPQIYWERGNKVADFTVLHEWWQNALKNTGTKLYIGIAAYKKNEFPAGEIEAQTNAALSSGGYIHYNYSNIEFPHSENGTLTVAMPEDNAVIEGNATYVIGYAEAGLDVKVNGVSPYRTMTGYYAAYIELTDGKNEITVTAGKERKKINVTVKHSVGGASDAQENVIEKEGLIGKIKSDNTILRASPSSSGTRLGTLCVGVNSVISAQSGNYSKLGEAGWVLTSAVDITQGSLAKNSATALTMTEENDKTRFQISMDRACPYTVSVTDNGLSLKLFNTLSGENSFEQQGENALCALSAESFGGYSVSSNENGLEVTVKHKKETAGDIFPLEGIKIVVDAGHGGTDGGASSPGQYDEADLNLMVAKLLRRKLMKYGAEVIMTREEDTYLSLDDRADIIRASGADIAVSIHHNSTDYSTDVTTVRGAMTLYSENMSRKAAEYIQKGITETSGRIDKGVKWQGLAVCRVTECPSVLAELGFICNPFEYEEISSEGMMLAEAQGIANGIIEYFNQNT